MKIIKKLDVFNNDENGSIIVIVAIFMTVIIGLSALVLDLGIVYDRSSKLQNALDSTALAATRKLPIEKANDWDEVEDAAIIYAQLNGVNIGRDNITPVDKYMNSINESNITNGNASTINGVNVTASAKVDYNFAKVFGVNNKIINKHAIAGLANVASMKGLLPFCMEDNVLLTGQSVPVYFDSSGQFATGGMFGIFNIDTKSDFNDITTPDYSKGYQYDILLGSRNEVHVGKIIPMDTGAMGNLVQEAYYDRIGTDVCTYDNYILNLGTAQEHKDCPRIAKIPIIEVLPSKEVRVKYFANVFIGNLDPPAENNGNKYTLNLTYINKIEVVNGPADSEGYEIDGTTNLRVVKLLD